MVMAEARGAAVATTTTAAARATVVVMARYMFEISITGISSDK